MEKEEKETMIEAANKAADRLENANKEMEALLKRQEEIKAREILGGRSEAGEPVIEETREEKQVKSARDMLKGTGYDDLLFPEIKTENR